MSVRSKVLPRLLRKAKAAIPIVIAALVLSGLFWLLQPLLEMLLPDDLRENLQRVTDREGDWRESADAWKEWIHDKGGTGLGAAGIFTGFQIGQVLFAPIPGQVIGSLGGFVFGFWKGLGLTMLGLTVGSFIAMFLSRLLGDKLVRRFVPKAIQNRFDHLVAGGGVMNFFVIFLLPLFPDDAICFIAGLTKLPLSRLMLACVIGRLPGFAVLTFVGASIDASPLAASIVLGVGVLAGLIVWIFEDEVKSLLGMKSGQAPGD